MRRAWPVMVVLALAGPAQAQTSSGFQFLGLPGARVLSQASIPAQVRGELVVSFHGDAGAGCATYGLCPYSGTIIVRPPSGNLIIATYRRGGRIGHAALLGLGAGPTGSTTFARVQRAGPGSPAGTCVDAGSSFLNAMPLEGSLRGSVTIRILASGGSLLQTRCAGPLDGDLAAVSPAVTIPAAKALRGRTVLDFSGDRAFAVHGFAGTVSSTVAIKLGRPAPGSSSSGTNFPPGIKTRRVRNVTERLSLVRVARRLGVAVRGTADPIVCRLLDTCGLSGTLSLGRFGHGGAQVLATGPASRPYRDFLTALGLTRSGDARGISVAVFVDLLGDVRADVTQTSATCTDTGRLGGVAAAVGSLAGSSVRFGGFVDSWRTRCPGPVLGNASSGLSASLARGALGHRQFTIELRPRASLTDDGYVMTPHGRLSAVVRRGRITQQVITEPVP